MYRRKKFIKLSCCFALLISSFVWLTSIDISQSKTTRYPKFNPPLNGTEILLEADLAESKLQRRGIWALDPKTGKVRFLIPKGTRPIWSPKRNYFAYQEHNNLRIVDRKGNIQGSFCFTHTNGQLVGWGHDEKWIIYIASFPSSLFLPTNPNETYREFQTIYFIYWNPLKLLLKEGGLLNLIEWFSMHPLHHAGNPSISPDGKQIAFEVFKYALGAGKFYSKIFVADLMEREGKGNMYLWVNNIRRLTQLPEEIMEINPRWSPDGNQIAFEIVIPQEGNLVTHIVNQDGSGLRGLKLYREEIKITTHKGSYRSKEELLAIEDKLVTENYLNRSLKVLGWLSNNRIVVAELECRLTRYLDYSFAGLRGVWVIDLEQKHPPILLVTTGPGSISEQGRFLCLSKNRLMLTGMVDDFLISLDFYEIPEGYDKDNLRVIHKHKSIAKQLPHYSLIPDRSLVVYWMNW